MKRYSLSELQAMPTIEQGHTDDLKVDHRPYPVPGPRTKVWLSRLTVEDGQPYDHEVTVEQFHQTDDDTFEWLIIDSYPAV